MESFPSLIVKAWNFEGTVQYVWEAIAEMAGNMHFLNMNFDSLVGIRLVFT